MRRIREILLAAAMLGALAACNSRSGKPVETSAYRGVDQGAVLAWAWGGAAGFEDSDPHAVVVLFDLQPGDTNHRLLSCNPKDNACKSLTDFTDTGLDADTADDTLFARFNTNDKKEDRLFLVVADRGAKLVTSDVITASAASRPTAFSPSELRFDRGTQQLAWPRLPDNDLFVVIVSEEDSSRPLAAVSTQRKAWAYPELQGVVQYFHDPARVPELRSDKRYVAVIYSINQQRWTTLVSSAVVRP